MENCIVCNTDILDDDEYATVWYRHDKGLFISFAHIKCSKKKQFKDITKELVKEIDQQIMENENDKSLNSTA